MNSKINYGQPRAFGSVLSKVIKNLLLYVFISASYAHAAPQAVVLQESYVGQFLIPPGRKVDGVTGDPTYYYIRSDNIWKYFQNKYANTNITYLLIIPQIPVINGGMPGMGGNTSTASTYSAGGIGLMGNAAAIPFLKGVDQVTCLSDYTNWSSGNKGDVTYSNNMYMRLMAHEMTHRWCCQLPVAESIGGHWRSNVNLFYGDETKAEIMGDNNWSDNNGTWSCQNANNAGAGALSDLSLYMMGLIDRTELKPITLYTYNPINDGQHTGYNGNGPQCDQKLYDPSFDPPTTFTGTQTITISTIENTLGVRNPGYANSPKDFTGIIIIPVPYGLSVDNDWINNYVNSYFSLFPNFWKSLTKNRSTMTFVDLTPKAVPSVTGWGMLVFILLSSLSIGYFFKTRNRNRS